MSRLSAAESGAVGQLMGESAERSATEGRTGCQLLKVVQEVSRSHGHVFLLTLSHTLSS